MTSGIDKQIEIEWIYFVTLFHYQFRICKYISEEAFTCDLLSNQRYDIRRLFITGILRNKIIKIYLQAILSRIWFSLSPIPSASIHSFISTRQHWLPVSYEWQDPHANRTPHKGSNKGCHAIHAIPPGICQTFVVARGSMACECSRHYLYGIWYLRWPIMSVYLS